jgi:hypothetical protein
MPISGGTISHTCTRLLTGDGYEKFCLLRYNVVSEEYVASIIMVEE